MSFREKSAWISLFANLAIYGFYFAKVGSALMRGELDRLSVFGLFMACLIAFVVVIVVLTVITAVLAPKEASAPADEREKRISLRGMSLGYFVMAGGVVMAMGAACFGSNGMVIANALFFTLVLAEVARDGTQIFYYRLGIG